jgi:hypothetical protein
MNSRERFLKVMRYEPVDRVPYFEEGIRDEVIEAWKKQGLPENREISTLFETDGREEIFPDLEPRPDMKKWPVTIKELEDFKSHLNPFDPARLPENWKTVSMNIKIAIMWLCFAFIAAFFCPWGSMTGPGFWMLLPN